MISDENLSIENISVTMAATKDFKPLSPHTSRTKAALDVTEDTVDENSTASGQSTKESTSGSRNISKAAMLRQLFFSQISPTGNGHATSHKSVSTETAMNAQQEK